MNPTDDELIAQYIARRFLAMTPDVRRRILAIFDRYEVESLAKFSDAKLAELKQRKAK